MCTFTHTDELLQCLYAFTLHAARLSVEHAAVSFTKLVAAERCITSVAKT